MTDGFETPINRAAHKQQYKEENVGSIYFTRHGHITENNTISENGKKELRKIKSAFNLFKFEPSRSFVSKAKRCVETAEILAPKAKLYRLSYLFAFGSTDKFLANADNLLSILTGFPDEDILVVCHDDAPIVYASRLAEIYGSKINWEEIKKGQCRVNFGEGFLVTIGDDSIIKISPIPHQ